MLTKYYLIVYLILSSLQIHLNTHPKYRFKSSSKNIPHPDKVKKGGEDAYFHNPEILVVADGVGFWDTVGIDPGFYSRKLVRNVKNFYFKKKRFFNRDLKQLDLEAGKHDKLKGTSTLVFAVFDDFTGELKTSNLGDSGFIILRENKNREQNYEKGYHHSKNKKLKHLKNHQNTKKNKKNHYYKFYKSKEQQHSFNFPYQLGTQGDNPLLAETHSFKVLPNDLIIVASDGLWDNIYIKRLTFEVNKIIDNYGRDLKRISNKLGKLAFKNSLDKNYLSPFEKQARKNNLEFKGGKSDDITVVVAQIVESK